MSEEPKSEEPFYNRPWFLRGWIVFWAIWTAVFFLMELFYGGSFHETGMVMGAILLMLGWLRTDITGLARAVEIQGQLILRAVDRQGDLVMSALDRQSDRMVQAFDDQGDHMIRALERQGDRMVDEFRSRL